MDLNLCTTVFESTLITQRTTFCELSPPKGSERYRGSYCTRVEMVSSQKVFTKSSQGILLQSIIGIYRAIFVQDISRPKSFKYVYQAHIDIFHLHILFLYLIDSKRLYKVEDRKDNMFIPDRIKLLQKLTVKPDPIPSFQIFF